MLDGEHADVRNLVREALEDPRFAPVIEMPRDEYREHGHTPNFRLMLKDLGEALPGCDSKSLYALFPIGPAKQGAKVAGLPQPLGKGGY